MPTIGKTISMKGRRKFKINAPQVTTHTFIHFVRPHKGGLVLAQFVIRDNTRGGSPMSIFRLDSNLSQSRQAILGCCGCEAAVVWPNASIQNDHVGFGIHLAQFLPNKSGPITMLPFGGSGVCSTTQRRRGLIFLISNSLQIKKFFQMVPLSTRPARGAMGPASHSFGNTSSL